MTDTYAAAVNLARRGLAVFPVDDPSQPRCLGMRTPEHDPAQCTERGKHPIVAPTRQSTRDEGQIRKLFFGLPRNVGVFCGPGLLVIDEDVPDAFAEYATATRAEIPPTYTVRTGKGRHYYFEVPAGQTFSNHEGALHGRGINVRSGNAYVVGAGSRHVSGRHYEVETDAPLAVMPAWLVDAIRGPQSTVEGDVDGEAPGWWRRGPIGESSRHKSISSAAGHARQLGLPVEDAITLAREVASRHQPPKYSDAQIVGKVRDHYARYADGAKVRDWIDSLEEVAEAAEEPGRVVDLSPFLDGTFVAPQPSVGGERDDQKRLLYPSRWHTVVGLTAAGKSWLALWHAATVMRDGGIVAYLHFEETFPIGTLGRLRKLDVGTDLIRKQFLWLDCTQRWQPGDLAVTLSELETLPTLVILDGINAACSMHGWPVDKPEAIGAYRAAFVSPATRAGAAVLSLGHPPKNRDRQGERHGFGSTAWLDEVDGVAFRLEASRNPIGRGRLGSSALYSVKDRYGEVEAHGEIDTRREAGWHYQGSFVVDDDRPSGTTAAYLRTPSRDQDLVDDKLRDLANAIWEYLESTPAKAYTSRRELEDALRARGVPLQKGDTGPALAVLEEWNVLVQDPYKSERSPRGGRLIFPEGDHAK